MIVRIVSLIVIWNNFAIILVINGVASVNVVAVPASKANTANKSIGIFDADKKETKHKIASLDEIYAHQEELKQAIQHYLE